MAAGHQSRRGATLSPRPRRSAIGLTAMYELHFEVLRPYVPFLLRGLVVTTYVSLAAMAVGTVLGLLLALARLSGFVVLSVPCRVLVDFVRGVPALVLLIYIYYGVSIFVGLNIPAMAAAIGGLGVFYAAYLSETFRAGILAVDRGQIEAAMSLGMPRVLVFRRVVMPHAFRIVLPPLTNSFISLFKDSSLVSVLAISELTREGQQIMIATFRAFEALTAVALIYYVITTIMSYGSSYVESWVRRSD
jgi:His/Glu/Gln/Arg/opine family amino acid ABC transporter permease subunit